jgi:hypothetical protein
MEESDPTKTEEDTFSSLRARDVGATATLGSFLCTVRKADDGGTVGPARTLSAYPETTGTNGLKEGAAGAVGE